MDAKIRLCKYGWLHLSFIKTRLVKQISRIIKLVFLEQMVIRKLVLSRSSENRTRKAH